MDREDRYDGDRYRRHVRDRASRSYHRSRSPYKHSHRSERSDLHSYLKNKMARLQEGLDGDKGDDKLFRGSQKHDHHSEERKEKSNNNKHRVEHKNKDKKRHKRHRHHHREHKKRSDDLNKSSEHSDLEFDEPEDEEALIERRRQERQKLLENLGYKAATLSSDPEASPKEAEEVDIISEDNLMKANTKPVFKSESAIFADAVDSSPNGRMSGVQAPAAVAFLHEHPAKPPENAEIDITVKEQLDRGKKFAFDIFSGEVPTAPANGVPGIMDPRAMASENHALVDNWDDAEGYYCKFSVVLISVAFVLRYSR